MLWNLAHGHIVHADPALAGAAPGLFADLEDRQDLDGIAAVGHALALVSSAGAGADIHIVTGNGSGARAFALGAVNIDVIHADPAVLGAGPGGFADLDLLQNVDAVAVVQALDPVVVGAGAVPIRVGSMVIRSP